MLASGIVTLVESYLAWASVILALIAMRTADQLESVEYLVEQPGVQAMMGKYGLDALVAPANYAVTRWAALDGSVGLPVELGLA